jgi:hypothetical protein
MAQTQHENVRPLHSADASADGEAWKVAAATRKYRIHEGKVWSGGAGMLFSLPPVPGFATLPDSVRPLVFQSVAQFVTNRVGQTAEGNVQEAINKAIAEGAIPGANTNDAFERHYVSAVTERVNKARPLPDKATTEQKAAQEKIIEATVIKNRDAKFDAFRDEGIAAALNKPVTEKKRKAKAAIDTSAAVDLD